VTTSLEPGHAALERGEWEAARECFQAALRDEESAEALEGLGKAAWWMETAMRRSVRASGPTGWHRPPRQSRRHGGYDARTSPGRCQARTGLPFFVQMTSCSSSRLSESVSISDHVSWTVLRSAITPKSRWSRYDMTVMFSPTPSRITDTG
jgi:hypothetical protein